MKWKSYTIFTRFDQICQRSQIPFSIKFFFFDHRFKLFSRHLDIHENFNCLKRDIYSIIFIIKTKGFKCYFFTLSINIFAQSLLFLLRRELSVNIAWCLGSVKCHLSRSYYTTSLSEKGNMYYKVIPQTSPLIILTVHIMLYYQYYFLN